MKKFLKQLWGAVRHDKRKKHPDGIVHEHDQVNHLIELIHYPDHPPRTESEEFIRNREKFHKEGARCWVDNGFCEGHIEIHHMLEWALSNAIDWEKVKKDRGYDHADAWENLIPLCHAHHQGVGKGIHKISYPAWLAQKYMKPEHLEKFEKAVKRLIEEGHDEHHINHMAKKLLLHLHATEAHGEAAAARE